MASESIKGAAASKESLRAIEKHLGTDKEEYAPTEHQEHLQHVPSVENSLVYDNDDDMPELHFLTYIAVGAMFLLFFVQLVALNGPPTVLSNIGSELHNPDTETWVTNSISLVQAVVGPVIASASDVFQARKTILVGSCTVSFVGACLAPGSGDIYRLIAAQVLIGIGFASVPLTYVVPSEVMPRKWRPMVQAGMNIASASGAIVSPLVIGALTRAYPNNGWRYFYWIQAGLWGLATLGILFGYRPPRRHTRLDHLSFWRKLGRLDLPGFGLLTAGLTLFLTGMNLGGGLYSWTNVRTLAVLVIGIVTLVAFGVWEWLGTSVGILHHDLFRDPRSRTFVICTILIFIEGLMLFTIVIFYPILIVNLWGADPFLVAVREMPFWGAALCSTLLWGLWSTRIQSIREPMFVGFLLYTAGLVGLSTLERDGSTKSLCFSGLAGLGFGAPLVLIVTGVQLSTPHSLIATASAVVTCARSVATTMFTVIYSAALNAGLESKLPSYIAKAAAQGGLPASSIPAFVQAIASNDPKALSQVPNTTSAINTLGVRAKEQAFADSIRVVFIIAAPFGVSALVLCFFLGDLCKTMNYHVDAPLEALKAKHHPDDGFRVADSRRV